MDVPPTIQYEIGAIDFLKYPDDTICKPNKSLEYNFKLAIVKELEQLNPSPLYEDLKALDVKLFLTSNYDYNINSKIKPNTDKDSSENVYSIHRWYKISDKQVIYPFHGEIAYAKTIQLGFDHYCGSLGRLDRYIKGAYLNERCTQQVPAMSERLKNSWELDLEDFDRQTHGIKNILSWIDAFFFTNLHIIGFGLDYSEIDVWWLLNRRARMMADSSATISNKIIYYDVDAVQNSTPQHLNKIELLKTFNVEVITPSQNAVNDYYGRYREQLENIKKNLSNKK